MSERSTTPVTYSREEIWAIRHMLADWTRPPICPRCRRDLEIEKPVTKGGDAVWHLECKRCRRAAFIAEVPGDHRADPDA